MPFPGRRPEDDMTDRLRGNFGFFTVRPPLQISFIASQIGTEKLSLLKTARQVLPRKDLRISELMQRDIDDERVREEIVNRYLRPSAGISHARFFPPLVVALLVRDTAGEGIARLYPAPRLRDGRFPRRHDADDNLWYEERIFGNAFSIHLPLREDAPATFDNIVPYGAELRWNRELVDLLVLDGQHRLVALKAALGQLDEEEEARGYEDARLTQDEVSELGFTSLPVCVIVAPDLYAGAALDNSQTLVSVYRQVFVDVNKNAKPVGESRNIILNERDLIAVFTQVIIEKFIIESELPTDATLSAPNVPLYAFEWDSSEKTSQINDNRAISSVGILAAVVEALLTGGEGDEQFRTELGIEEGDRELDPAITGHAGPPPADLGPKHFSGWQRESLVERFNQRFTPAIIYLLSGLFPARILVAMMEERRVTLLQQRRAEKGNPVPLHEYDYLVGTKSDRAQIETVARMYHHRIGRFDPSACATAIEAIKHNFLDSAVVPIRTTPFGRLFFSKLGQTQLFEFVFRTLHGNAPDGSSYLDIATAFVADFNVTFDDTPVSQLFSPDRVWNVYSIATLGMQGWKHAHVAGLLSVALAFFPVDSRCAAVIGSDKWPTVRRASALDGIEEIRSALLGRMSYQVQSEVSVVRIVDTARRREKIRELSRQRASAVMKELETFISAHTRA
jgi:hypothetical protein